MAGSGRKHRGLTSEKDYAILIAEISKAIFGMIPPEYKDATQSIPIEDIGVVVLNHKQIIITQGLLEKLLENNCALITCGTFLNTKP